MELVSDHLPVARLPPTRVPLGSYTFRGDDRRSLPLSSRGHVGGTHRGELAISVAAQPSDVSSESLAELNERVKRSKKYPKHLTDFI